MIITRSKGFKVNLHTGRGRQIFTKFYIKRLTIFQISRNHAARPVNKRAYLFMKCLKFYSLPKLAMEILLEIGVLVSYVRDIRKTAPS